MQRGRRRGRMGRVAPRRVASRRTKSLGACARAHPWDLESSGLCRERAEELGRLAREVGESVPEVLPLFFARGRQARAALIFALFLLSKPCSGTP